MGLGSPSWAEPVLQSVGTQCSLACLHMVAPKISSPRQHIACVVGWHTRGVCSALAHQSKGTVSWDNLTQKLMPLASTSSSPSWRDREPRVSVCTSKSGGRAISALWLEFFSSTLHKAFQHRRLRPEEEHPGTQVTCGLCQGSLFQIIPKCSLVSCKLPNSSSLSSRSLSPISH